MSAAPGLTDAELDGALAELSTDGLVEVLPNGRFRLTPKGRAWTKELIETDPAKEIVESDTRWATHPFPLANKPAHEDWWCERDGKITGIIIGPALEWKPIIATGADQ